jgi:hypothetical protein
MEAVQELQEQEVMETVKNQLFFHDAWNEYAVILPGEAGKFSLSLGAGLHYYMGLSRMTMASTLNFLTVDSPIFTWPLIDNSISLRDNWECLQR